MTEPHAGVSAIAGRPFDVIVVGGGITGCGIAREATLRGLSVALLEQGDFASGTSSRSSRLVHGGVRYLEHGHLKLVFEASAERRRLLRLAPHLVHPLRFTWPVYRGARVPRWKLAAGLTLYDALALFRNVGRHHWRSPSQVLAEQPTLRREGLVGGADYFDARTDDSRLTLAVAMDARRRGAAMHNHARVVAFIEERGRTVGVVAEDAFTGARAEIRARVVVNATGPWSDGLRKLEHTTAPPTVQGSKGVHICVDRDRIGNHQALTLLSPDDGRVMFVLPSGRQSIIGTTDTFTGVAPDAIRASVADVDYLLTAGNHFFPAARLTRDDVISAWAGIRPLARSSGDSVSASREHAIAVTPTGVVTITGGKLTTYRVMGAQTVDVVLRQLGRSAPPSHSDRTPLAWNPATSLADAVAEAARVSGDAELAERLVGAYGQRWPDAWRTIATEPDGTRVIVAGAPYRMGELRYCCRDEAACTLDDLLIRRMRIAFETRDHGRSVAMDVATYVAPVLAWSASRIESEVDRYAAEVARIFAIDPR